MAAILGFFDYIPVNVDSMDFCLQNFNDSGKSADKLWTQPKEKCFPSAISTIFKANLGKKRKTCKEIQLKTFYFTQTHLLYNNNESLSRETPIRGSIEISWARVHFGQVENEQVQEQGYLFKAVIARNKRYTEIYISD